MEVGCGLELRPTPVLRVFRDLWRAGLKRAGGIWSAYLCAVPIFGQSVLILSKVGGISGRRRYRFCGCRRWSGRGNVLSPSQIFQMNIGYYTVFRRYFDSYKDTTNLLRLRSVPWSSPPFARLLPMSEKRAREQL